MVSEKILNRKIAELPKIDRVFVKCARFIDNIDMYLGPFADAAQLSNSEVMNQVGYAADVFQYFFLKIPFATAYLLRTKDINAVCDWIPREIFAVSIPYGGLVEILRNYESCVLKYYKLK